MEQMDTKLSNEIDLSNTLIPCPDRGFAMRKANVCFMCEHYQGIMKATERGEYVKGNEAVDFQILCGRPITRKLIQVMDE